MFAIRVKSNKNNDKRVSSLSMPTLFVLGLGSTWTAYDILTQQQLSVMSRVIPATSLIVIHVFHDVMPSENHFFLNRDKSRYIVHNRDSGLM